MAMTPLGARFGAPERQLASGAISSSLIRAGLSLLAACQLAGPAHADPVADVAHHPSPISVVEIPVTVDLTPLFDFLEQRLPRHAGVVNRWQKFRDVRVQYGIQRGPVEAGMSGERLAVTIPLPTGYERRNR